ncbi:uncharacterized protein LOC128230355 [Mya arenaria]|uniref:uncharacterized protein LOC128230355 n=1 Tax=Mya arenaria TaxID=6604 RepID=UPI0022E77AA2|nr:uncharacterized protein LOC128230355 [Mya arenaria]
MSLISALRFLTYNYSGYRFNALLKTMKPPAQILQQFSVQLSTDTRLCSHCMEQHSKITKIKQMQTGLFKNVKPTVRYFSSVKASKYEDTFPLRFIYLQTSVELWEEFPEGLQYDVGYVDTGFNNEVAKKFPVILGLPSSVATHMQMEGPLLTFAKLGYRVIILNMPDSPLCRGRTKKDSTVFEQSVLERSIFIRDFLNEIKVDRVDLLVANSCSVYSAIHFTTYNKGLVSSLALLNPTGLDYTKDMRPVRMNKYLATFWGDRMILQELIVPFISLFKQLSSRKRDWSAFTVVTYAKVVSSLSFQDVSQDAKNFRLRKLPTLIVHGEDSTAFNKASSLEYLEELDLENAPTAQLEEGATVLEINKAVENKPRLRVFIPGKTKDLTDTNTVMLRRILLQFLKNIRPDL